MEFSYYLLLCFSCWKWDREGSFQVNEATNVVFMILGGCFISEIVFKSLFSVS